ncbi:sodium:solute symporter family protein [Methanobacterium formicicum]|jgi:SSS family solute:Na+ symporter|uniref:Sodium solute transporter superfamily protein n=2 Tax=Methanobacterium formicicum TaxID=2162 RepID=A0A090I6X7_METFO|nr:sodium/solute symporter [Methanobacterium formicicum]MBF4475578.1 sodium/solute symporter [Methanobacterium formicicum]MDH2659826.1 sodium/solute symporter [Methanobacterium formicicum]CEA12857.1 sodium solute transporter superfamily protein [Methanobacterium formicicum]
MNDLLILSIVVIIYLLLTGYVGYVAWRRTKTADDYMVAGRETHPFVMALSYGATFISTAAIVGFGGTAGVYGMGLLWLTFLNILVGIFIAFVFFGKRTRKMGHNLGALTFPEFLSKRFDSRFIQYFSGLVIFFGMTLYASVVLIGMARFAETTLSIDYNIALVVLAVIVALYVIFGGIRGVMYTDALQGTIMFVGMFILLVATYWMLGGVTDANQALTNLVNVVPAKATAAATATGFTGWTSMPALGSPFWWTLVSTLILGVGIGVLSQPQLVVRFMTVKSNRELNRAVLIGGIFILLMTGTAFIVGALSNVYFFETAGKLAMQVVNGNADSIIPAFITAAMPLWFAYLFMITLLSAAMSTLSAQIHTQGTALGRDIYETLTNKAGGYASVYIARLGIAIAMVIAVIMGFILPTNIIAVGTSMWFSITAAAFLSMYVFALFWKGCTKAGAISGLVVGTLISLFWLVFEYKKSAEALGIAKALTGKAVLTTALPWPTVDPIVIALPIALVVTVVVSLLTRKLSKEHMDKCFEGV